jgi:Na+/proline symporter
MIHATFVFIFLAFMIALLATGIMFTAALVDYFLGGRRYGTIDWTETDNEALQRAALEGFPSERT